MTKYPLLAKTLSLIFLGVLLWIPLTMISGKIGERNRLQQQVEREIESTAFGAQRVIGPIVVLACIEDYVEETVPAGHRDDTVRRERKSRPCPNSYVFPDELTVTGELPTEVRRRGIHAVRLYQSSLAFRGSFRLPDEPKQVPNATRRWSDAALFVAVGDLRGLKNVPILTLGNRRIAFQPGTRLTEAGSPGIHAPIDLPAAGTAADQTFAFTMQLYGMSRLAFVPMAKIFTANLQSPWTHPSFDGQFLPDTRTIGNDGFRATWTVNHFAAGGTAAWSETLRSGKLDSANAFGVSLIDPVNVYSQSYRAAEYGILLVGLTFALFLLLEVVKRWQVHAVQYGLIGLAQAVFFLLLLALAEHIGFAAAYLIAASACVGLLTFYIRYVVGSVPRALAFGAYFVALYGTIYVMLSSEDAALLLGSLLVFAVLAATMIATRRLDWFSLSASLRAASAKS
ncbi:MAG TPA: cell envelope integrity protein CreD [Casimicrobiaceae bacterium]|nr:cell envelope integrity protein CreD [Casimicrobiaceae bacterium]